MGTCIICGTAVEGGHVCASHEEDVCFEFRGDRPDQLTPGRFYEGSVDGFADFGVFIDIGDSVTGLLHTSELDRRLESIDWQPGDTVYVQVKNVRDNGNVDLGWSIRQHESEFRGKVIDTPEGDRLPDSGGDGEAAGTSDGDDGGGAAAPDDTDADTDPGAEPGVSSSGGGTAGAVTEQAPEPETAGSTETEAEAEAAAEQAADGEFERTPIETLEDHVGDPVRLEGEIVDARQTSGPTIFEVRDETGVVECAAFEQAGVRAYPEAEVGDVIRLNGEVERRRGELQVETADLEVLDGEDRAAVLGRLEAAIDDRARPEAVEPLAEHDAVAAVADEITAAATAIRRAVFESRPVVIRHSATTDGYLAGAALERAALALIREEHEEADAEYHYVDRRPLDGRIYDMQDAMRDTTSMLDAQARHDERIPLFVFVNAGSTAESGDGFDLLDVYDARRVVIEGAHADGDIAERTTAFVNPVGEAPPDAAETVSTTALAANVAAHVAPEIRAELRHLPAASYWREAPEAYSELAAEAGHDADDVRIVREAMALEAFYQAYQDKRELVEDLLFADHEIATHAASQFRTRVNDELRTARSHVERHTVDGRVVAVLDTEAYTHAYEFPPAAVLLAELADEVAADAILGVDTDTLIVQDDAGVDMREVGDRVAEAVPEAGVETRAGRDGHLVFLRGERDAVVEATVEAVAAQL